jgi:hypothetical protein
MSNTDLEETFNRTERMSRMITLTMASKLELDKGQESLQTDLAFGLQKMKSGQDTFD